MNLFFLTSFKISKNASYFNSFYLGQEQFIEIQRKSKPPNQTCKAHDKVGICPDVTVFRPACFFTQVVDTGFRPVIVMATWITLLHRMQCTVKEQDFEPFYQVVCQCDVYPFDMEVLFPTTYTGYNEG